MKRKWTVVTGVVLFLILCVWVRVDFVKMGYRIQKLEASYRILDREQNELNLKISSLNSLARLEHAATRLGMIKPQPGQIVVVRLGAESPTSPSSEDVVLRVAHHIVHRSEP